MSIRSYAQDVVTNAKVAGTISASTTSTGLATFLEWIPADIGKLGTLVGILLSSVLIYVHLKKGKLESEKTTLEIQILKDKIKYEDTN